MTETQPKRPRRSRAGLSDAECVLRLCELERSKAARLAAAVAAEAKAFASDRAHLLSRVAEASRGTVERLVAAMLVDEAKQKDSGGSTDAAIAQASVDAAQPPELPRMVPRFEDPITELEAANAADLDSLSPRLRAEVEPERPGARLEVADKPKAARGR